MADDSVDELTDAVLTASRLLVAVSARSIAAVDDTITLAQFRLLVIVFTRGTQRVTALAELLGVNPSSATRTVDRLVHAGLLGRRQNPAARRETHISLTPAGSALVAEVTRRRRVEIARIVAAMPMENRRGLVAALAAFAEAGDEPPAGSSPYRVDDTDWA
ncbi:Transcriptional regulator, MarR family [Alloactinosynnema sp. L-07]|uniref:MarR family winged helix-turn-helix transcriptional regulator n=1 Tax=Alloactinosynnema sp. L-07 TaxID=1653480 RepID=UPI00065EFD60|nr:MarR family transcriptional regulator [Alloactinosynnema sp. L-07]CRK60382.1 Transcriptional regulator, MarR family [Alloactinosynnema sp. L-07]